MPLKSLSFSKKNSDRLTSRIRSLIRKGEIQVSEEVCDQCKPGFCMNIQIIPKKQVRSLEFGKAEGLRVFVDVGKRTVAAVDFFYSGSRLRLSQIYQGKGLRELLAALNDLEELYAKKRKDFYVELISFLLAPGFYLRVSNGKNSHFYEAVNDELKILTKHALQNKILMIIDQRDRNFFKPTINQHYA